VAHPAPSTAKTVEQFFANNVTEAFQLAKHPPEEIALNALREIITLDDKIHRFNICYKIILYLYDIVV
jgi:hypothetical protein